MIYNINSGGSTGNMIIRVTVPADKVGETITCTLGSTVLTDIVPDDLVVEFKVKDFGNWVIACDGLSKTINTYYYGLYLVNIEPEIVALVPVMTSNTTPYGVAFADSEFQDNVSKAYNVFRGITDGSVRWASSIRGATLGDRYIGYKFINPVCVQRVKIQNYSTVYDTITSFKVQASNDGTTWVDVTNEITKTKVGALETEYADFDNDIYYQNWRVFVLSATGGSGNTISLSSLQFYGYEE